jgi:hypothetical protein
MTNGPLLELENPRQHFEVLFITEMQVVLSGMPWVERVEAWKVYEQLVKLINNLPLWQVNLR